MASATNLARTTFVDQIRKAGLDPLVVQEASLVIVRGSADHGFVNRRRVSGYHFTFELVAISDLGKRYGLKRQLWVAPHSGLREYRSVR